MTDTPLQPDTIRLRPGEQHQLSNYPRRRYICACIGQEHEWLAEADHAPDFKAVKDKKTGKTEILPRRCEGGKPWRLDVGWVDPARRQHSPTLPQIESKANQTNWEIPGLSDKYANPQVRAGK